MFNNLIDLFSSNPIRAYLITFSMIIIFLLLLWVSYIDIKKQCVTFWKMLIVSSSTILFPIILSFFCGCKYLKWFLIFSLILWILLLYLNVKFNKDKFVGKADIDLLSALFSETIMFCVWMFFILDKNIVWIRVTHVWYSFFLYLLLGSIIYILLFLCVFSVKVFNKKVTFKELIKGTKISVIPMLIPISLMIPYIVMTA